MSKKYAAVVLSAGKGTRMNSEVPKQYLLLEGMPVLCYSLQTFQQSMIEEIVLVCGEDDLEYCRKEIVEKYGYTKVRAVVAGGRERYHSVCCGLEELAKLSELPDYVMIHDGARPFADQEIIERCAKAVEQYQACVAGMPVKDTIKIADEYGFAAETPERKFVWQIQTPQVFAFSMIYQAYRQLLELEAGGMDISVTDDAMVVETVMKRQVRLVEGSYKNIKITTPEDLEIAKLYLKGAVARSNL